MPFEDWHTIFSQQGGVGAVVNYHTSSVVGANPLGAQASINFFTGETLFLSEIQEFENQAIAWKVEGEVVNFILGDVNQDGLVNLLDIEPFVELLTNGGFQDEADINKDGVVDLLDVAPFVELLSGN